MLHVSLSVVRTLCILIVKYYYYYLRNFIQVYLTERILYLTFLTNIFFYQTLGVTQNYNLNILQNLVHASSTLLVEMSHKCYGRPFKYT